MKKILLILSFFVSYSAYAQYVPKAGNKLNVKPNGILVPTSSADDTPVARLEVFASGVSTIKPTVLPIASASLLGAFRVGTGLSIDGSGILSTVGGSAPDTTIYRTVANSRSLAQTQTALNAKQNNIILTTTGTSGAATLIGSTLNIPNYSTGGGGGISGLTTNYLPKASSSTSIANSRIFDDGTNLGIGTGSPTYPLDIDGGASNGVARLTSSNAAGIRIKNTATNGKEYNFGSDLDGHYYIYNETNGKYVLDVDQNGKWFIGETGQPVNIPSLNASALVKTNSGKDLVSAVPNTDFLPVASPTMTGTPIAPTPGSNINTTQIPTTAWTNTYYAAKASPTFTGTPAAPTATAKTSTTQIATTAFVGKQFTATGSGTGAATTISFAHGVTGVTSANSVIVTPNNAAAAGLIYVTLDSSNVNVVYSVAPASGTGNLAYSVSIK